MARAMNASASSSSWCERAVCALMPRAAWATGVSAGQRPFADCQDVESFSAWDEMARAPEVKCS
jgi:hypothetical protein